MLSVSLDIIKSLVPFPRYVNYTSNENSEIGFCFGILVAPL